MSVRTAACWTVAGLLALRAGLLFFSKHDRNDISQAFHSENAFYYSFFDQVITAATWREGLRALHADVLSEAPAEINALRRFNIYQEMLFGLIYRCCAGLQPNPAVFYCVCTFVFYGIGLLAWVSCSACFSSWCALAAGALYYNNFETASHITYMPPLRENCGISFWFGTCASILYLHSHSDTDHKALPRIMLLLSCIGFLLVWQFSCFALALQLATLCCSAVVNATSWCFVAEVSHIYCISTVVACALRFGDLWSLRSVFFALACAVSFARMSLSLLFRFRSVSQSRACRWIAALLIAAGTFLAIQMGSCVLVSHLHGFEALDDDAHVFEFLAFRLGLRKGPLGYHATLYEGQRSFSSPTVDDWRSLCCTGLIPTAGAALGAVAWALLRAADADSRYLLFPHVFLSGLTCATLLLFSLMLRYRMFFIPNAALLGSTVLHEDLCPGFWRRLGHLRVPLHVAILGVLVGLATPLSGEHSANPYPEDALEQASVMQWLKDSTRDSDVIVADMGLSALVRLHAKRAIICHPHYETAALRDRCFWTDKLHGHRSVAEYHDIIRHRLLLQATPGKRILVLVGVRSCFSMDEKGRLLSKVVEQEEQNRTVLPQTCELMLLMAGKRVPTGFVPRFVGRWYSLLEMLPDKDSVGRPLKLDSRAQCSYARLLLEDLNKPRIAASLFQNLLKEGTDNLDARCRCAGLDYWPPEHVHAAHRQALQTLNDITAGSLGCCRVSPKLLNCVSFQARSLQQAGDLTASELYHQHAVRLQPSEPRGHGFLGFTLFKAGRYLDAVESMQQAAALEAGNMTTTTKCGEALSHAGLGDMGSASAALETVKAMNPQDVCLRANPGLLLASKHNLAIAEYRELQAALERYDGGIFGWQSFIDSHAVAAYQRGPSSAGSRRLIFLGNAAHHLPQVLRTLRVLRHRHRCHWPAEFWIEAGEMHLLTSQQLESLKSVGAALHVIPSPFGKWRSAFWDWRMNLTTHWRQTPSTDLKLQKFALKPLVLLLSSCAECLFLDSDNLMLRSPEELLERFPGNQSLFWPDVWDPPQGAVLWKALPAPEQKSQESGQLLVRKVHADAVKALLLAVLFAVRIDVFLDAIYAQEDGKLLCGYGDKDAFLLAFRLLGAPIRQVASLPGVLLDEFGQFAGLLHTDGAKRLLFVHSKRHGNFRSEALKQCHFKSQADAVNVTCTSDAGKAEVNLPLDKMRCRPLGRREAAIIMADVDFPS